jgi:DNA-binding transcriptional LysR family regulator
MRIQYSVDDLRGFCSLVRLGQYTDAAEQLSITPSALSRRIQNLERAIGGKVFDRTTRKVLLTPAGVALYERVVPLLSDLDSGLTEAARVLKAASGSAGVFEALPEGFPVDSRWHCSVDRNLGGGARGRVRHLHAHVLRPGP